ncbi:MULTISPECIES: formate dehydrogenase subunit alpha [Metallosphaera]|uniref:Formate dehydrogenase, alpha subunit n=3 Tax=Metallosphaera TaxID=41980 RepID=A4YGR2_METS5|nr:MULTISPECIES: formate dehydrogenase subunit alpha [Metallosphaera]ABP95614.1 formate dehydrogenase, alpha subunit [Metallosphaera sedula DSM 5348]AIM27598.1 formate dehydrogenase, alpha subunit [Metallosphaera sedula]AKV74458.1 formate dehydrogenase [Metallosphaera sedula]AKV76697.1 formate dehydrogenase [Metallosphaera sedula]AKV78948.1 formate dehydrogenase [Metallosphaera sedula]
MLETKSICPYCGVGCGLILEGENNVVARVYPDRDHVVSKGHICGKGSTAHEPGNSWDRLLYPLKREKDILVRISWDEAIREIASKLSEIRSKYGPSAIGFYGGCQNTLEEGYTMMKLARALGTNNVDSCARVCHDPSATALKEMVGLGATSTSVTEIPKSKVLVIVGESLTESHPVLVQYLSMLKKNNGKVVVIDPRVTGTARLADLHLRVRPGTDIYLFNAVANYLISNNIYDKKFVEERVEGFVEFSRLVKSYTIQGAEEITGIDQSAILEFAKLISQKPVIFSWGLGLTQTGGPKAVRSLINLALLTGNVGFEGAGLLVYRGQTNVQGSGDMIKPNVFPNGPMTLETARELEKLWGFLPPTWEGKTVTEALLESDMKAVVLMNFNPAVSFPNRQKVENFLKSLELLVVMDPFMTETARFAHYVLPSAMWTEKEGSVTSLDRVVKWRFRAVSPPGEAKEELEILSLLADRLGFKGFSRDPKEVFKELRSVVKIYSNLTLDQVMDYSSPSRYPENDPVLYRTRFYTASGKAKLKFEEQPEPKKGLILITGRAVTRYNTDEMISRTPGFGQLTPVIYLNPRDAQNLGIKDNDLVKVSSRCGMAILSAKISPDVLEGTTFAYMHVHSINNVVCDELDPETKTPRYKYTEITITKIEWV